MRIQGVAKVWASAPRLHSYVGELQCYATAEPAPWGRRHLLLGGAYGEQRQPAAHACCGRRAVEKPAGEMGCCGVAEDGNRFDANRGRVARFRAMGEPIAPQPTFSHLATR